jgi:hypothetical protein
MCPAHSNGKPAVSLTTTNKNDRFAPLSPPAVDFAVRFVLKPPTTAVCVYWF